MKIPRFWAQVEVRVTRGAHEGLPIVAWGWSDEGDEAARQLAEQRAGTMVERIEETNELPSKSGGAYSYADRPLREEILGALRNGSKLERFPVGDDPGDVAALISRNAYGAEVLNTERLLMLDADQVPARPKRGLLARLFGPARMSDDEFLEHIRSVLEGSGGTWRIYRTFAGFRLLRVDRPLEPGSGEAQRLLALPFVDDAYRTLCRVQESYRARLTPKPFRCELLPPPVRFPYLGPGDEETMRRWLEEYDRVTSGFATCRFVESVGGTRIDGDLAGLVELHDERTGALSDRPLA